MFNHEREYLQQHFNRDTQSDHNDVTTFELMVGGVYSNAMEVSFINYAGGNKESQQTVKTFIAFAAKYKSHADSGNTDPPPNTALKEGLDKIVPDLSEHQAVNALEL